MAWKGSCSGAGSWAQNLNIKYSTAAGKKFSIPKSKLYRFLSLSKLEHLISIIIFNRVWFNWSDQDQNRSRYQMLHKKTEPSLYHETVHKHCFMFPGREAVLAAQVLAEEACWWGEGLTLTIRMHFWRGQAKESTCQAHNSSKGLSQ